MKTNKQMVLLVTSETKYQYREKLFGILCANNKILMPI